MRHYKSIVGLCLNVATAILGAGITFVSSIIILDLGSSGASTHADFAYAALEAAAASQGEQLNSGTDYSSGHSGVCVLSIDSDDATELGERIETWN